MIFHNLHTITIDRFGLGFKFPSKVKRLPIPMPKKWVDRAFNKLVIANNKNTNSENTDDLLDDKYHLESLGIRIELMGLMFLGLEKAWVVGVDEQMAAQFKEYFKKDFDINGLDIISKESKKLRSKYNALHKKLYPKPDENKQPENTDQYEYFQTMIMNIESHLYPQKIGMEKLYMLPLFISKANKIMKLKQPTSNG